ncbi:bifunctional 3-(3-hydroxy-phenyl)propionate/3-hydroxycinnamic acid hydroxylase [Pseudofrankia sp. BMG5.37]|uniref:bifunctional 3-(3-hydroxy-phenyl)propionate/3-hydroxycinnamic acid hydroxylase MhpA n=1 Tax=Pseudofrankia sp. BMG5.37 TaxID=3050035 RepID=UPI0028944287|nr:bifunctional 3-(3-hydroxy-phenyl)propionate/3-hydroxycinnamic acid hydroxylase [Pseudofrankia sp. BMG5.37]MDT3445801.1 bifunctional 3-(3-hydroxy-phenyl)propionate/3-hydroxycinnamic acid hydroxylase [Pseudofrankia sp. BMG5.37]
METYDVAVVGYGPVGQLLVTLLGQRRYRTVVLERFPEAYPLPRAVHFDHEVARILQAVDLRSDRDPVIEPYDNWYEWRNAARKTLLKVDWRGVGPSWWHTSNFFSQPELERELDLRAQKQPTVTLIRGMNVSGVEQDPDGVTVTAGPMGPGFGTVGEQRLRARYVVGCDGANSVVRSLAGLPVTDLGFFYDWLILDMVPHQPMTFDPPAWQLCDPTRPTTIVPGGPGRRRWEFMALPGEDVNDLNKAEKAWELLRPWGVTPDNATLERHTVYRFQARWAQRWRNGRLLIAGDAAHLMPPFAGQGMCAGVRDVYNLAWKLDLVLRGTTSDAVLDTYGPEREPHVRYFIDLSMELGRVICVPDRAAAAERDRTMIAAIEDPNQAPPPAAPPRLGPGILADDDTIAGLLSIQSRVGYQGREGLYDDLVGYGWFVLTSVPILECTAAAQVVLDRLGIRTLRVGPVAADGVDLVDVDGRYGQWFKDLDAQAVVVRPDFYIYAHVADLGSLSDVLERLGQQLPVAH